MSETLQRRGPMQILPVIDLMGGVVVRGRGGRRGEYRPIVSPLARSAEPRAVAEGFRKHFGLEELYLADLDALGGAAPSLATYRDLQNDGFRLWVDAGLRQGLDVEPLLATGVDSVIAGLESVSGPEALAEMRSRAGGHLVFSLDLKAGTLLGSWTNPDPLNIVDAVQGSGVRRLLVLDLARVGEGQGPGSEELCTQIATRHPELELFVGGGIRDAEDVRRLARCGARGVLLASSLHDGTITPSDIEKLHKDG